MSRQQRMAFDECSDYRDYRTKSHGSRGDYGESKRSLHSERSHKSKTYHDHIRNKRSKRSKGTQRPDKYIYDDRYRERSRSNSRARGHRSHFSDRSSRTRYVSRDRRYSRNTSRARDRFRRERSSYGKSHRTRYGSGDRHYSDKEKHDHYKDRDNYYLGSRLPDTDSTISDTDSTISDKDVRWENAARRERVSNCIPFTQTVSNDASYPREPFRASCYHQNTWPMGRQILQPKSNFLPNASFPYVQENADVSRLLSDIKVCNLLDHILRSGHYAQPVPLNINETPSVNATVFHEAEHRYLPSESGICETEVKGVADSDYTGAKMNRNSEENKNCEMDDNRILDEEVTTVAPNEMCAEGTTKKPNHLPNLKLKQSQLKVQVTRLPESVLSELNGRSDVCVSQDDAVIADHRTKDRHVIRPSAISQEYRTVTPLTNKEVNRKRPLYQVNDDELKSDHDESMIPVSVIKNNNPEWNSLNKGTNCIICKANIRNSLVSHYVNAHPESEVIPSRVSPNVGNFLRNSKNGHKSEKVKLGYRIAYNQYCYFCNDYVCLKKSDWMYHLRAHTGYYKYKCTDCVQSLIKKSRHSCKENIEELSQPQLDDINIIGYLCNLCNYVRLDKKDIENHLKHEHEGDVTNNFEEFLILSFPVEPVHEKKHEAVNPNELNRELIAESSEGDGVRNVVPLSIQQTFETRTTAFKENDLIEEKGEAKMICKQVYDMATQIVKNIDPQYHSTNHGNKCKICNDSEIRSIVSHYVNEHPNREVFTSRVAPDEGDLLRKLKDTPKCEAVARSNTNRKLYKEFCFFCNKYMRLPKYKWINHLIAHTGYYRYKCGECLKRFVESSSHVCENKFIVEDLSQPEFEDVNVMAYICDICNYVRLSKTDIESHLKCEHEGDLTNRYEEVIILSFPGHNKSLGIFPKMLIKEEILETPEFSATSTIPIEIIIANEN